MSNRVVAVVGARGNVGASTLALHLAGALGAVVVDAHGAGNLDVLAGIEGEPGLRWPQLATLAEEIDGKKLRDNLPAWYGVPVLSGDRGLDAAEQERSRVVTEALCEVSPVVVDASADALAQLMSDRRAGGDPATVMVAGLDVMSAARVRSLRERSLGRLELVIRRCPQESLAPIELVRIAGVRYGIEVRHCRVLRDAAECGVGPSRTRPRWSHPPRRPGRAALVPDRAAAAIAARIGGDR